MIEILHAMNYPITIGCELNDFGTWLPMKTFSQIVIITDHRVKKLHGLQLRECLQKAGHSTLLFSFPAGENYKNYHTIIKIMHAMQRKRCDRDTLILALGGGVVGDIAGFIAAIFLRGVSYLQIPTTLLAMVDSSVGGKTGINTLYGKNLIGAIYQPIGVVVDMMLLQTLPKKQMINGLIEAVKMFITHDAKSFATVETHLDSILQYDKEILKKIITQAIKIKSAIVTRDEKEMAERSVLNFGHTIGHALEKNSNYDLYHGYAVGYGILVEATIAHLLGLLNRELLLKLTSFFARLGIRGKHLQDYSLSQLITTTQSDKKVRAKKVQYVLLQEIGSVQVLDNRFIHPVADSIVKQAYNKMIAESV